MPINIRYSSITLEGLDLSLHLGWPTDERAEKQTVRLDVHLSFPEPPKGCITDHLDDAYCYDKIITQIRQAVLPRQFRLIEHLGHAIYEVIQQALPPEIKISLRVKKQTAIPDLKGGAMFYYGDENKLW